MRRSDSVTAVTHGEATATAVNLPRPQRAGRRHSQLSEVVANHVREAIMAGELKAPDFIRTEPLAEELGVSPTPVREAMMVLQSEGTVHWEPRRGFRVVPLTVQDVRDVFAVQAYIAGELAARAVDFLPDAEIDRMMALQVKLEEAARRGDAAAVDQYNQEIHRTINRASGSRRMAMLLRMTVKYVPLEFFGTVPGWAEASSHDHAAVFKGLRQRDAPAARRAMVDHITHIGDLLVQHLDSRGLLASRIGTPEDQAAIPVKSSG